MQWVGLEPATSKLEWAKAVLVLDSATTVIGNFSAIIKQINISRHLSLQTFILSLICADRTQNLSTTAVSPSIAYMYDFVIVRDTTKPQEFSSVRYYLCNVQNIS
jgi:hypothetical protein